MSISHIVISIKCVVIRTPLSVNKAMCPVLLPVLRLRHVLQVVRKQKVSSVDVSFLCNFIKLVMLMISATLVKLLLQVIHVLSWLCYVY